MNYKNILGISFSFIVGLALASYHSETYEINPEYSIEFSTGKAKGNFTGLKGDVSFNATDLDNSSMKVTVDVNTIETGNTKKDKHARGKKWFHAEKYPTISFTSNSIKRANDAFIVNGDLTIKNVTQSVEITFTENQSDDISYLNGTFEVNRKDFNIKGNLFGFAVGKKVKITLKTPAFFSSN